MTSSLPQRLARWLSGPHRGTDPAPAKPNAEDYLRAQQRDGTYPFIHINKCGGTSVEQALGLPKIHEHDGLPPQGFGIFVEDRLVCLYTFESDLGDGWEDPEVHKDPEELRQAALRMGANILQYVFGQ